MRQLRETNGKFLQALGEALEKVEQSKTLMDIEVKKEKALLAVMAKQKAEADRAFKLTGGRRIFRMTPIHHHFELGGWDEEKITLRFWIVGIIAGLIGVTLFLASINRLQ